MSQNGSIRNWTIVIALATVAGVLIIVVNQAASALMDRTSIVDKVQALESGQSKLEKRLENHDADLTVIKTATAVVQAAVGRIEGQQKEQNDKLDRLLGKRTQAGSR
jgi:hypothetical protein